MRLRGLSGDDPGRLISCWRGGEEHVPEGSSRTSRTMFLFFRYAGVQRDPVKTAHSSMENLARVAHRIRPNI